jgi:hypothetical protein
VCLKGNAEGVQLVHVGDIAPRVPVFACSAHVRSPYTPFIDVEVTVIPDCIPSGQPLPI